MVLLWTNILLDYHWYSRGIFGTWFDLDTTIVVFLSACTGYVVFFFILNNDRKGIRGILVGNSWWYDRYDHALYVFALNRIGKSQEQKVFIRHRDGYAVSSSHCIPGWECGSGGHTLATVSPFFHGWGEGVKISRKTFCIFGGNWS